MSFFQFFLHGFEYVIEGVYLLEDVGQFGVILFEFYHFGLELGISCLDLGEEGEFDIVYLAAESLDFVLPLRHLSAHLCDLSMDVLLECVVLFVLDDNFIVLLLLLVHQQVNVEILVPDVFGVDLHLGVALCGLFQIFGDLP